MGPARLCLRSARAIDGGKRADRRNIRSTIRLLPAGLVMALCGVIPIGSVAIYSVHDTFGGNAFRQAPGARVLDGVGGLRG
jgi:hypothetical protein